ncbi:hypothetical protein D9758_006878 [Tetrapyrgos nigripes]|uniref:HAT C-terminal dimerisation domain-containing protein n=1 Tax=Tetrapyrgos nigripes TaxID=182062 RepID=A0A8H5GSN8_9AGAR|nr:hypothetical protein D9758_006878 [Tetrapyrgos nigripes]
MVWSKTLDSTTLPAVSAPIPSVDDSPVKFDFLSRYAQPSSSPSYLQDELDEYFQITSSCAKMSIDPLEWWYAQREQFPNLFHFAHDVLYIPSSTVAIEQVFSGGRDTVSLHHASLKADTIQALMVVKAQL